MNQRDLKIFNDVEKHLKKVVKCVEELVTKVDDVLGDGLRKKSSSFYLPGQVEAAKTLTSADRRIVEGHIAALKSVQSDIKAVFKDFAPLAGGYVDVDDTFSDLPQLRRTYTKAFASGDSIYDLEDKFFASLKDNFKNLYDSEKVLQNGSMAAIYRKLPEFFKEYPPVRVVLGPDAKKR